MMNPAEEKRLAVLLCRECAAIMVWPRHGCASCGSIDLVTAHASGEGHIHSITVVHRPPDGAGASEPPYAVALVALDIGGRLMARVPPQGRIGDRIVATREDAAGMPCVNLASDRF